MRSKNAQTSKDMFHGFHSVNSQGCPLTIQTMNQMIVIRSILRTTGSLAPQYPARGSCPWSQVTIGSRPAVGATCVCPVGYGRAVPQHRARRRPGRPACSASLPCSCRRATVSGSWTSGGEPDRPPAVVAACRGADVGGGRGGGAGGDPAVGAAAAGVMEAPSAPTPERDLKAGLGSRLGRLQGAAASRRL